MSHSEMMIRSRVRLTKEGSTFLTNYALTVNSYPQKNEKLAILASLRAIPGNETFTLEKLASWFARHRKPLRDLNAPVLLDDETILFPKLTPTHLQQLRVLYKKRSDPSDGMITFWANRINVERTEVAAWIQYQQEKAKETDLGTAPESPDIPLQQLMGNPVSDSASVSPTMSEFPRPHLPTPAESLSPSISPQTRIMSLPPIAVKVEESRQCLSSLGTPTVLKPRSATSYLQPRSVLEGLPPLSRLRQTAELTPVAMSLPNALFRVGGQLSRRNSNAILAETIRDSLRSDAIPSEQPPRTAGEFAEKFEGVKNMIEVFMKKYDSGELVRLGWDSSLSKVPS